MLTQFDARLCFFELFGVDITERHAGLSCLLLWVRQAPMRARSGTNCWHKRMTSGVHACSAVCWALADVGAKLATIRAPSKPAAAGGHAHPRRIRKLFMMNTFS